MASALLCASHPDLVPPSRSASDVIGWSGCGTGASGNRSCLVVGAAFFTHFVMDFGLTVFLRLMISPMSGLYIEIHFVWAWHMIERNIQIRAKIYTYNDVCR
jgi:hypothetical protein